MQLAVHTTLPPAAMTGRVRALVSTVDAGLVVTNTAVLSDVRQGDWYLVMGVAAGLALLAGVLVALATSGLYAMLALSVAERTREIGIRAALGAPRGRLLFTILRRPLAQIALGALIGLPLAARFLYELGGATEGAGSATRALLEALGLSVGIVLLVGVGSSLVPGRRVLAVDASEAMRAEG
jgi:ABC-type antimicrobial peptide transport system permease subunit